MDQPVREPPPVRPVHAKGDFCLAVTLGARATEIAENPRIGVVPRVAVLGDELAGPERRAPVLPGKARGRTGTRGAMRLGPETAAVRAGQDGPASRPLPGRAPWSSRPQGSSSSDAAAERSGRRAAEGYRWVRTTRGSA
ncbi:hypothetical protein SSIG_03528 [Streptomyces filamentosus NRRL 11379]|uniref:Predicted protein n=1 Tax=Streptomyces filamentosus NRRL 15998 TaxID=457431 RepID=D6ARU5_STRFL|nr:predicted protein [Streptomyces filamentosus NRRL 15998]EWS92972.1 hypothetical protein SSIG_03528 [Streptomyces filamentosus NRRL 11379]